MSRSKFQAGGEFPRSSGRIPLGRPITGNLDNPSNPKGEPASGRTRSLLVANNPPGQQRVPVKVIAVTGYYPDNLWTKSG